MTISEYKITKNVSAPKVVGLQPGERTLFQDFPAGINVKGYMHSADGVQAIIVGPYGIPISSVEKIRDISIDGKPVDASAERKIADSSAPIPEKNNKPNSALSEEIDRIKKSYTISNVVQKSRNSVNGMLIGVGAGFLLSLILKKQAVLFMIGGGAMGGFIGNMIKPKTKSSE